MADYIITRSDELMHHGIKGQKWGVRRYQNPDGTLTEAGKARIAKTAGSGYLNPSYDDVRKGRATERKKVGDAYSAEFWQHVNDGMSQDDPSKEGKKLWDKYKSQYASATLRDLKMADTPQARKQVRSLLSQIDASYKYENQEVDGFYEREKKAAARRQELEHPGRGKAKKAASTVGKAGMVAIDVAKPLA